MTIKSICPTLWKLYVTIYFPRSYWHSSPPKYHHLRRVFNEIERDHQHICKSDLPGRRSKYFHDV